MKSKNAGLLFILSFIVIIFSVPISQAILEHNNENKIQILKILEDMFVTPITRAKKINIYCKELEAYVRLFNKDVESIHGNGNDSTKGTSTEDCLSSVFNTSRELTSTYRVINQFINQNNDDLNYRVASNIELSITKLQADIDSNSSIDSVKYTLQHLFENIEKIHVQYPEVKTWQIPLLIVKNLGTLFLDSRYIRPFEKEVENASVCATKARPVMSFVRYCLFGDLGGKAILGKNGMFFYRLDVQYIYKPYITEIRNYADKISNVIDPELLKTNEEPQKKIVEFKKQLQKKGIDLLVVVVPTKPSIYPEELAINNKPSLNFISPSIRFIDELRAEGVDVINLFDPLNKEKANDPLAGEKLYLQKDTHWKSRAAFLSAKEIAKKIKNYSWYKEGNTEYEIDTVAINRTGDIASMAALDAFKIRELSTSFPTETTTCYQVVKISRDDHGTIVDRSVYKDDYQNSSILLLGDSFSRIYQTDEPRSAGLISHLAFFLHQPLATIVNDGGASTIVREVLARKNYLLENKRLVIWEFVERDIRFGEKGWKTVSLSDD